MRNSGLYEDFVLSPENADKNYCPRDVVNKRQACDGINKSVVRCLIIWVDELGWGDEACFCVCCC
jgi:hypothetical protein